MLRTRQGARRRDAALQVRRQPGPHDVPERASTGLELSEWHSGYRAYRVDALADIDLDGYTNDFDFDTEIILGLHAAGKQIAEVPIPTYYGDEICHVNGLKYAKDVTVDVLRYQARRMGFGTGPSGDWPSAGHRGLRAQAVAALLAWPAAGLDRAAPPAPGPRRRLLRRPVRRPRAPTGPPRRSASTSSSTKALASGSTTSSRPTSARASPPSAARLRRRHRRRLLEHVVDPEPLLKNRATTSTRRRDPGVASPTSRTGTPAAASRSVASTTTSAAPSTTRTCASSPAAVRAADQHLRPAHRRKRTSLARRSTSLTAVASLPDQGCARCRRGGPSGYRRLAYAVRLPVPLPVAADLTLGGLTKAPLHEPFRRELPRRRRLSSLPRRVGSVGPSSAPRRRRGVRVIAATRTLLTFRVGASTAPLRG